MSYQTLYQTPNVKSERQTKILVIDDDPLLRSTIELILDDCGHKVCLAEDGLKGLRSYRIEQPDLVITDLNMPVKGGLDTIQLLRTWSPSLKIIAMSGGSLSADRDMLHKAVELGASATMCKPFEPDQLIELVSKCLTGSVTRAEAQSKPLISADLEQAIETDGLFLEYLPKVDYALGRISGVEALVRWRHPEQGIIRPDRLIALAEESDLICRVTDWVVSHAANQVAQWRRDGLDLGVSVNLSARDVEDLALPTRIAGYCYSAGIDPTVMTLELSETNAMHEVDSTHQVLAHLGQCGFGLSVDDFCTGQSSLVKLKRLPFTEVKIDRPVVSRMMSSDESRNLVKIMIDLAHKLDLKCVAEGVENAAEFNELRKIGCEAAQGYFLSGPIPGDQVAEIASRYTLPN